MVSLPAIVSTLGVGGLLGYGAGVAVKSVTRLVGCLIGVLFILMQVLAYYGLAEWHWDRIAELVTGPAASAAQVASAKLWKILTYNLPFTGGFAAGFYMAMRR
ncbi:MAG: FUN14 domain-containing protein [Armatimonadota bacterium]|nr:FUN14 domain-containing protein [Armatimonadota bacterium]